MSKVELLKQWGESTKDITEEVIDFLFDFYDEKIGLSTEAISAGIAVGFFLLMCFYLYFTC